MYSGRNMSVGVRAGYRYARTRIGAFELNGTYMMVEETASGEPGVRSTSRWTSRSRRTRSTSAARRRASAWVFHF